MPKTDQVGRDQRAVGRAVREEKSDDLHLAGETGRGNGFTELFQADLQHHCTHTTEPERRVR
jgi:hypothetical protein